MKELDIYQKITYELYSLINQDANKEKIDETFAALEQLFLLLSVEMGYNPNHLEERFASMNEEQERYLLMLEEKAKQEISISFVQEQVRSLAKKIRAFWQGTGFNYVDSVKVDARGMIEVKFAFGFDFDIVTTDKKITAKENMKNTITRLEAEGFLFDDSKKRVIDCESNYEKLKNLLLARFPSAVVQNKEVRLMKDGRFYMDRFIIKIRDPLDI